MHTLHPPRLWFRINGMKKDDPKDPQNGPDVSIQGAVCVIDGDTGVRKSLESLVRTLGLQVATFATAEEFLVRPDRHLPAFVITELDLPGMDGFRLKEALDRRGIEVPVIGLATELKPGMREEAARLGFSDLVEKPFVSGSVIRLMAAALGLSE